MNDRYVIAGQKPWNRRIFEHIAATCPGAWMFVANTEELAAASLLGPRYIFYLHWSNKVLTDILERVENVAFHATDLPFGRGGSPLQNLVAAGFRDTVVTAFRMTEEMDAGPIYLKKPLSLEGLAEEIYIRAGEVCAEMIEHIVATEPTPTPQTVDPGWDVMTSFRRRRPDESEVPACRDLQKLFDHLRMLDADTYPRAFLIHNGYRYEFSRPALRDGRIEADVKITKEV